jgi:hypothetical protein
MAADESEVTILDELMRRGFVASFIATPGGLRLVGEGRTLAPDELTIRAYRRFEGVSDPDDMSIVYAIEARDGTRGTLVDAFGVYASPAVAAVLNHVRIQHGQCP